jgi:uncharacterized protein YcbX
VVALTRYPVKSLCGDDVDALDLDARGVVGDRYWSVRDAGNKIGSGKSNRRFAALTGLLTLRAQVLDGEVCVTFPDGATLPVDDPKIASRISAHVGQPVTVATETETSHFDDGPVSLLGLESVMALAAEVQAEVDPARFRTNILVGGWAPFAEDDLLGRRVRVGESELEIVMRSTRCVMVDMETADLPAQHGNLRTVGRLNETCLGVIARVVQPGRLRLGDPVIAL